MGDGRKVGIVGLFLILTISKQNRNVLVSWDAQDSWVRGLRCCFSHPLLTSFLLSSLPRLGSGSLSFRLEEKRDPWPLPAGIG